MPAVTIVAAWIKADTGVGPAIASGNQLYKGICAPVFEGSNKILEAHEVSHSTEWMLTGVSTALIVTTILFAWNKFSKKPDTGEATGFRKVLADKWYVDELYEKVIVNPLDKLALFFKNIFEKNVVDGIVNGVGRAVNYGSRQLRLLQSGQVGSYVLLMVLGMVLFFVFQFFLRN